MNRFRSLAVLAIIGVFAIAGCSLLSPVDDGNVLGKGPAPVSLGTAGQYVILSKAGVTTTGVTAVTGHIGVSPAAAASITGFGLVMDATGKFSTSTLVTGKVYASNYSDPTPANLTTAIGDMETAYTDAATRIPAVGSKLNLGAGTIGGNTIAPGLYTWGTSLNITSDITLSGGALDTWIFQIAGTLSLAHSAEIVLSGGALAKNIVWQIAGSSVSLGTDSHFEGIILANAAITFTAGATMNGRAFAKTAVALNATTLTKP